MGITSSPKRMVSNGIPVGPSVSCTFPGTGKAMRSPEQNVGNELLATYHSCFDKETKNISK
jgi:hypothetical protein